MQTDGLEKAVPTAYAILGKKEPETVNPPSTESIPQWDLTSIYPSLESAEYASAGQQLNALLVELEQYVRDHHISSAAPVLTNPDEVTPVINTILDKFNQIILFYRTMSTYANLHVAVNSFDAVARRKLSESEQVGVRIQKLSVPFQAWLGKHIDSLPAVIDRGGTAAEHAFYLRETAEQSRYLMSEMEEGLASELNLSGASAWSKLQGTVCSQLVVPFERDGKVEQLPITALVNLHGDADPDIRRRAYDAELKAWKTVQEPLAAAMNGIKGTVNTLNHRRGRSDALHMAIDQARIDRPTLETMMGAMQEAFPVFRRYLRAKARLLGEEALPWWDVFAPMGKFDRKFTFSEAQTFILDNFGKFSGELADFARNAFEKHWIDAESRNGKRGGAFCALLPAVEESRVMCNFDGSLDQTSTIAHELGHGFHNYCMKGKQPLRRINPMTLAETASTFCETIVADAALAQAKNPQEELSILETFMVGANQVIVDITSRFIFEKEVFERREKSELSADELCEIMVRAQKATYGDGLDDRYLHPYMWTWKPHYYSAGLSFYNFPYAFGLLFGLGLYAIYEQRGPGFLPEYKALLSSTGEAPAADLAARFGIDIRKPDFWRASLGIIEKRVERYCEIR